MNSVAIELCNYFIDDFSLLPLVLNTLENSLVLFLVLVDELEHFPLIILFFLIKLKILLIVEILGVKHRDR